MPRVSAAPTDVQAGVEIYPKGPYELKVSSLKAFEGNQDNDRGERPLGVRVILEIQSPAQFKGKRYIQNCYQHNDGSRSMSKQFIMAVTGYGRTRQEEVQWDEAHSGETWDFDTDTGSTNEDWNSLIGKLVAADFDIQMNKQRPGEEQQKVTWRPVR